MPIIREVRGKAPIIGKNVFIAETAVLIGEVTLGDDCSVWYNAVLRGDVNAIVIGNKVNIQDNVMVTTAPAATIELLSTTQPSKTIAPIPISTLSLRVQPCMMALCPMETLSPMVVEVFW